MRALLFSALAAGLVAAGGAAAQTPQAEVALPLVEGMEFDDGCGPRPQFQGRAICVRGALASIGPAAEAYIAHYASQGWEVVAGEDNGVVLARRRPDGACDGLEIAAFYDESRPVAPATQAWIAFAPLPGNLCAGTAAQ
jgi:hypothetical protein